MDARTSPVTRVASRRARLAEERLLAALTGPGAMADPGVRRLLRALGAPSRHEPRVALAPPRPGG